MAKNLWGQVFFNEIFAGFLREEPGNRYVFQYDPSYLEDQNQAISYTMPLREKPYENANGLHPFFDNLVAEGWLENAQMRVLGKRNASRFELLLGFGFDCAGAVSVRDPDPLGTTDKLIDIDDPKEYAIFASKASLSGIQPKMAVRLDGKKYVACRKSELSTHIAKFPSSHHPDLVENELLSTAVQQYLLPHDKIVKMHLGQIDGIEQPALIIERFDRSNGERIHFEEFNQLLDKYSNDKYEGNYKDMANFISNTPDCIPAENYHLFGRLIVGFLLGNTDMHLKNFAMIHTSVGLRLSPAYDIVNAYSYGYKTIALGISGAMNMRLGDLKAKHIIKLGQEFNLNNEAIYFKYKELDSHMDGVKQLISEFSGVNQALKNQLIETMDKRWNGTFRLIGEELSKKP